MAEVAQTESNELPDWAWIRFIPVKLHIIALWTGAGLGYLLDEQLGTEWWFAWILGLLVGSVGVYWQDKKVKVRNQFYKIQNKTDFPTHCPHCNNKLQMKSFRLYLTQKVSKCSECGRRTGS